ncbi:MmpS family protein [Nocardia sp. NBC_00511]
MSEDQDVYAAYEDDHRDHVEHGGRLSSHRSVLRHAPRLGQLPYRAASASKPQRVKTSAADSILGWNMNVQNTGSGSISCRVTVDGVVKDEQTVTGFAQIAQCTITN